MAQQPSEPSAPPEGSFFSNLRHDLPAGLVVLFVAVPLCLGIALASGAPLFSGLIAGIIGGIVVGAISGSPLGVSGPAAGLAVIVLNAIHDLKEFDIFLVAVVIGGVIQIAMGLVRAGILAYFFPSSVIKGMLAGIGILIVLKQIPHALGHDETPEGQTSFSEGEDGNTLSHLVETFEKIEWNAFAIAAVCLFLVVIWEQVLQKKARIFQLIQGPLAAVAVGILYQVSLLKFAPEHKLETSHLVRVPVADSLEGFLGNFTSPDWSALSMGAVWITGVTIAVVASLETLLCVEATDKLDPIKRVTPTNRELVAQGTGNILSGLIGGLPITQVIVRSSANIQSGGRSKTSTIVHGLLMLTFVMLLPKLLNLIPLATLAAILLVVGYKLAKPALFLAVFKTGWSQFLPFVITIGGIVFTDLLSGIGMGMAVALLMILIRNYENSHFLHREESDADGKKNVNLRLSEEVSFLNKGAILRELSKIPRGSHVTLDLRSTFSMHHDVVEIIEDFKTTADRRQITVETIEKDASAAPA